MSCLSTLQVNWDGTYQDSLAYPADVSNSTITNSRDIRDTDLNFLNFSRVPGTLPHQQPSASSSSSHPSSSTAAAAALASRAAGSRGGGNSNNNARQHSSTSSPPYAPPPSASNSSVNCHGLVLPPATPSSSASSVMSQPGQHTVPTEQRHHQHPSSSSSSDHSHHQQQKPPDVRWTSKSTATATQPSSSPSASSSSANAVRLGSSGKHAASSSSSSTSVPSSSPGKTGKAAKPRLAHVDVKVIQDSKTSSKGGPVAASSGPAASRELATVRRQVEDRWALSRDSNQPVGGGGFTEPYPTSGSSRAGGLDLRLAAGGEHRARDVATSTGDPGELYSPRRARPIKKAITADLKEDGESVPSLSLVWM